MQDTGKYRINIKDQFYTNTTVAKECIQCILTQCPYSTQYIWIEPSAGNGAFLHNVPNQYETIGIDIDPKADNIHKADFLTWNPPTHKKIILFGNPPFGRQASLAKAFITKGCQFADIIAFILPKSFVKPSMSNVFDTKFHCKHSVELEKHSFVINDAAYDVPCVFQIWEKQETDRPIDTKVKEVGFCYVKPTDVYDIAFRRVGGLAGKSYKHGSNTFSAQSHYFITLDTPFKQHIDTIIEKINTHEFPSNTVGPRSLSKTEINSVINAILQTYEVET